MAQPPTPQNKIDGDILQALLKRAQSDSEFRAQLLDAPEEVLKGRNIHAAPKWVAFFKRLKPANFEETIRDQIRNDPTGEGEGEG